MYDRRDKWTKAYHQMLDKRAGIPVHPPHSPVEAHQSPHPPQHIPEYLRDLQQAILKAKRSPDRVRLVEDVFKKHWKDMPYCPWCGSRERHGPECDGVL